RKSGPVHFKKRDNVFLQIKLGRVEVINQGRLIRDPWPASHVARHFMKARLRRVFLSALDSLVESFLKFRIAPKSIYQITNCHMVVPDIQSVHSGKRSQLFPVGLEHGTAGTMLLFFAEISPA